MDRKPLLARLPLIVGFFALSGCAVLGDSRVPSSADSPPAPGLYVNGDPDVHPALQLVQSAKSSIDIEIYEMEDSAFLEAVRAKNRDGVKVRIIKDPYPVPKADQCLWFVGLRERDHWADDPKAPQDSNDKAMRSCASSALPMISEIQAKGGEVAPFYKPHLCGQDEHPDDTGASCYEHGKIIVVDGKTALVSTGNFNGDNFCDEAEKVKVCNRDFSYVTGETNEVGLLESIFENDLKESRYALHPLVAPATSKAPSITASPYSLDPLVDFIKTKGSGKGHLIQIENQYLKEPNLNQAIQEAAKAGSKVQEMVASLCAFGAPKETERAAMQALNDGFTNAGVELKYFPAGLSVQGHEGYLHAKAIAIDGKLAWVGSVNGSNSALNVNREFGIFFSDAVQVDRLAHTMAADFADPAAETFEQSFACANDRASPSPGDTPKPTMEHHVPHESERQ